jgi:hypothetical protein
MAEAGLLAITNKYGCKDLSRRFAEIISIESVDPELLADAINAAVQQAEEQRIGKVTPRRVPRDLGSDEGRLYSPQRIAEILRAEVRDGSATHRSAQ